MRFGVWGLGSEIQCGVWSFGQVLCYAYKIWSLRTECIKYKLQRNFKVQTPHCISRPQTPNFKLLSPRHPICITSFMSKLTLRGRDLREIGYPQGPVISKAIEIMTNLHP